MHERNQTRGNRERQGGANDLLVDLDWADVLEALHARWPRLDKEDVAALARSFEAFLAGDIQLLVARLRERYGLEQLAAEDDVRRFVRALADPKPGPEHSHPR